MAKAKKPVLQRQVGRAHRRMALQTTLNCLCWSWVAALVLASVWFLVQPLVIEAPKPWLRWAIAGSCLGVATLAGLVIAYLRAPSQLQAALSLDSAFGLKERVTTSLTLAPEQVQTSAGQALLQDVNQRVTDLDIGSGFPIRLSWQAALVPAGGILLALVAVFYEPTKSQAISKLDDAQQPPRNAKQIEQKMEALKKKVVDKDKEVAQKSEEIEKLEAELDKIANKPRDTKEQVRERIKEMTALEDVIKQKEKELAEKSSTLKQQLSRLDKASQKNQEGPAKELEKALQQGKMDKAREEVERLAKQIQNNTMTEKEKEDLKKQLDNLQEKLENIAQQKEKEQQLRQANLDPETLQRELDKLKKDGEKMKGLQDLAKQLGDAKKKLDAKDLNAAADDLSQAAESLKKMEASDKDLEDLRDQLARLTDAKDGC